MIAPGKIALLSFLPSSGDKTVTSGIFVGVAAVSTVRPEPSAVTRTQVGVATRSQPTISVSVAAVAGVGVVTTSAVSASGDVTVTSGMFVGIATRSQPTISATVATLAVAGALLQSGGAQVTISTTSRGTVGVVTIATPGGEVVVSFGPLITFRSPRAVAYTEPGITPFREPRTVR